MKNDSKLAKLCSHPFHTMIIPNVSHNDSSVGDSEKSSFNVRYSPGYVVGLGLFVVLIFLVNFLIIYLFSTRESLRTDTNRILASLAVTDMINGVVTIPLLISTNHHNNKQSLYLAAMVLYRFVATSTMLHILVVTLERHICVIYPLHYNSLVTKRRIIIALCVVWITSIVYAVIGLTWLGLASDFNHREHPPVLSDSKSMQIEFSYTIIGFLFWFIIPLLIMSYSFTKILREISRHNRRESELMLGVEPESARIETAVEDRTKQRMDRKPVLIFMAMLLVFIFSWSTWYVQIFILSVAPQHFTSVYGTAHLFTFLRSVTSFINPLLYSLVKKDFRRVLKKIILHAKTQGRDMLTLRPSNEFTLKSIHTADTIWVEKSSTWITRLVSRHLAQFEQGYFM